MFSYVVQLIIILAVFFVATKIDFGINHRSEKEKPSVGRLVYWIVIIFLVFTLLLTMSIYILTHHVSFLPSVLMVTNWLITYFLFKFGLTVLKPGWRPIVAILSASLILAMELRFPHHWLMINLSSAIMCAFFLVFFKRISFWQTIVIAIGCTAYDVWAVWGTQQMLTLSKYSQGLQTAISVPTGANSLFQLGAGDIIFPGLAVMMAINFARKVQKPLLAYAALTGYAIGYFLTVLAVIITGNPQPATIYLFPSIFALFLLAARRENVLRSIWP
ncbi:TPA: hypothetical protein DD449_04390 [Candidatus Berkelbacteria bacterium]|uniref:Signal peptide peptidase-like 2A-like, signal peptide peptidase-like protein 2A n=1 Tax=Berkelbacteria bacterium GW2011_GWE1_39_12 TaxID=1618337 RepID=A0A0G4B4H4_9BACT|nr:MAG: signal peptide peptidase-like 2A-like, signal peptide peptidase-like protein 2A [Berkelbacteria bacterium GW2011_GWE1_39_12]HBO60894.1 hypothetical protein [Candidatus Berkelbacteria bacterium]